MFTNKFRTKISSSHDKKSKSLNLHNEARHATSALTSTRRTPRACAFEERKLKIGNATRTVHTILLKAKHKVGFKGPDHSGEEGHPAGADHSLVRDFQNRRLMLGVVAHSTIIYKAKY